MGGLCSQLMSRSLLSGLLLFTTGCTCLADDVSADVPHEHRHPGLIEVHEQGALAVGNVRAQVVHPLPHQARLGCKNDTAARTEILDWAVLKMDPENGHPKTNFLMTNVVVLTRGGGRKLGSFMGPHTSQHDALWATLFDERAPCAECRPRQVCPESATCHI